MNLVETFKDYLEDNGFGVFGTSLFIGGAPLNGTDDCYWILASGGNNITKNTSGEKQKNYIMSVYHRAKDAKDVYDNLQELEELINSKGCIELNGYIVLEAEATVFPTDQDLDIDDRTVGLIQVTLTIYGD